MTIELLTFVVSSSISLIALLVAISAKNYAEKAFSLSLFDKRYKIFHELQLFLGELSFDFHKKSFPKYLDRIKLLLWEAQYIFDNDVCDLMEDIKRHLVGCIQYFQIGEEAKDRLAPPEDISLLRKLKVECYSPLEELPGILLGNNEKVNLDSYFHKYLIDKAFRKPLPTTVLDFCKKFFKKACNCIFCT